MVAGNSEAVTLSGLKADTQYQVTVAAVWAGKKYRSRPIVFRTLGTFFRAPLSRTGCMLDVIMCMSVYTPQRRNLTTTDKPVHMEGKFFFFVIIFFLTVNISAIFFSCRIINPAFVYCGE